MNLISIILLALSTNIDNVIIAINIGVGRKHISVMSNIFIALVSAVFTLVFSQLAFYCGQIGKTANIVGSVLIIILGISSLLSDSTTNNQGTKKFGKHQTLFLAIALAVNCVPVAFGVGLTGMSPIISAIAVGIFGVIGMRLGNYIGLKVAHKIKTKILSYIAGFSMILLGIFELVI